MQRQLTTVSVFSHNEIVREGLKRLLVEGKFSAACYPISELKTELDEISDSPDHVVLLEAEIPEKAIEIARDVRKRLTNVRLALLTNKCEQADVRNAMAVGVDAYLSMGTHHVPLLLMLELVSFGEKVFPKEFFDETVANEAGSNKPWSDMKLKQDLSKREYGILQRLVDGGPNKVIARKLGITEATVKIHVKVILRKLNVVNRTQAAIWMVNNGCPPRDVSDHADGLDGSTYSAI
jgi:two-component system, NarL family, nitrate/nitrite response regulator NarL